MGGQTALNIAVNLAESGVLAKNGVEMIGAEFGAQKHKCRLFDAVVKHMELFGSQPVHRIAVVAQRQHRRHHVKRRNADLRHSPC